MHWPLTCTGELRRKPDCPACRAPRRPKRSRGQPDSGCVWWRRLSLVGNQTFICCRKLDSHRTEANTTQGSKLQRNDDRQRHSWERKEASLRYLERVQKQNNTEVKTTSILNITKPGHMILEDVDSFPSFQKKRKKDRKRKLIQDHLSGFVHTYMYVFKKIRFRVSTRIRAQIRRSRPCSHRHGLIPGSVLPPALPILVYVGRNGLAKSLFFCLFPLLASVVLLYCFTLHVCKECIHTPLSITIHPYMHTH